MLNHLMIGTNDMDRAQRFYDAVLGVLGAGAPVRNVAASGQPINGEPATVANGATIGFKCNSPEQVLRFHEVALAHGGVSVEGPPGPRTGGLGTLHLAYVRDPDGHKLCAIHRPT